MRRDLEKHGKEHTATPENTFPTTLESSKHSSRKAQGVIGCRPRCLRARLSVCAVIRAASIMASQSAMPPLQRAVLLAARRTATCYWDTVRPGADGMAVYGSEAKLFASSDKKAQRMFAQAHAGK